MGQGHRWSRYFQSRRCRGRERFLGSLILQRISIHLRFRALQKVHTSGGKDKLGSMSKQGDRYLRSLFTTGALAVIRYAKIHGTKHRPWLTALLTRRPTKVAAIALANKIARMAWARLARANATRNPSHWRHKGDRDHSRCEGWQGEQHVMQSRSSRRSGQPTRATALSNASC